MALAMGEEEQQTTDPLSLTVSCSPAAGAAAGTQRGPTSQTPRTKIWVADQRGLWCMAFGTQWRTCSAALLPAAAVRAAALQPTALRLLKGRSSATLLPRQHLQTPRERSRRNRAPAESAALSRALETAAVGMRPRHRHSASAFSPGGRPERNTAKERRLLQAEFPPVRAAAEALVPAPQAPLPRVQVLRARARAPLGSQQRSHRAAKLEASAGNSRRHRRTSSSNRRSSCPSRRSSRHSSSRSRG